MNKRRLRTTYSLLRWRRSSNSVAALNKFVVAIVDLMAALVATITVLLKLTQIMCNRLNRRASQVHITQSAPVNPAPASRDDVVDALRSLGCTVQEAKQAAVTARKELGQARDEDLVRAALRSLARYK